MQVLVRSARQLVVESYTTHVVDTRVRASDPTKVKEAAFVLFQSVLVLSSCICSRIEIAVETNNNRLSTLFHCDGQCILTMTRIEVPIVVEGDAVVGLIGHKNGARSPSSIGWKRIFSYVEKNRTKRQPGS